MSDTRPIGIFDSGLGGLTVAKEIIKRLPCEDIVYFGDTGRIPYGTRSRDTIERYAVEDENFLLRYNVKLIVAACGTVSSVAAHTGDLLPVPFVGVVSHAVHAAIRATRNKKIGVIGTAATINSGAHKRLIKELLPDAQVVTCSCNLFTPLVEEGWIDKDDPVVYETAKRYLEPILNAGVDTLILGCTHYPVLSEVIQEIMGNSVTLINMGEATADYIAECLKKSGNCNKPENVGKHSFFVSDKPESFKRLAEILLGETIIEDKVKQVNINAI